MEKGKFQAPPLYTLNIGELSRIYNPGLTLQRRDKAPRHNRAKPLNLNVTQPEAELFEYKTRPVMQIPLKILFICTHNRCRSILAEAIANHVGEGYLVAASAGSEPAGAVHPQTLQSLQLHGIPATALRSKSWDELLTFAPHFVITVCDNAAAEPCPLWLGKTRPLHWGLADPSVLADDEAACRNAFDQTIAILSARLLWLREGVKQGLNLQGLEQLIKALADTSVRTGRQEAQWACSNAI